MRLWSPQPISTAHHRLSLDSPVSPLVRSPKGWKKRESDGVGLGIVVSLNNKSLALTSTAKVVVNFHRVTSPSIPITSASCAVTEPRFPLEKPVKFWDDETNSVDMGLFCTSPLTLSEHLYGGPASGFLNSCHLCMKNLDGEDIYMYRGEKAFCSTDCRYRHIVADEYQESYGYKASRISEMPSSSVCSGQRIVCTGIMAA
ncbi:hypothetical protein ZOSMA_176G00210 [Zostera marina]|uniref:FLZ-type domain-containing protein n=1 Tax=Zostera marina TaxID=29655 RepID=A0A0K9PU28_ZOSMR|nr:hypothetical protein ZOSMA_176G00210 [Zostera marina]